MLREFLFEKKIMMRAGSLFIEREGVISVVHIDKGVNEMLYTYQLTTKQEFFCAEYLIDHNATQAAIRAGYSKKTAAQTGHDNLKKPGIMERIQQLQELRSIRTQVTADRVIEELAIIAFTQDGVKNSDKLKALGMLMKHLGLFQTQKNQPPGSTLKDDESKPSRNTISDECNWVLNSITGLGEDWEEELDKKKERTNNKRTRNNN